MTPAAWLLTSMSVEVAADGVAAASAAAAGGMLAATVGVDGMVDATGGVSGELVLVGSDIGQRLSELCLLGYQSEAHSPPSHNVVERGDSRSFGHIG